VAGLDAEIEAVEIQEAAHHEAGARQQHERQRARRPTRCGRRSLSAPR
jgi:hypothetical protein